MNRLRILLADDHKLVLEGLQKVLASEFEVIGQAEDGRALLDAAQRLHPDAILVDISMPLLNGIDAVRKLRKICPESKLIVVTMHSDRRYVVEAFRAGASGFILKTEPPERLVDAVRIIAAGDALLGPEITRRLIDRFIMAGPAAAQPPRVLATLTPREKEVLALIARGLSNSEIAQSIFVSEGTVKTHVARILTKLGLRDRVQAVVFAYEHRLVGPRPQ